MTLRPLRIVVIEDYDALREAICDALSQDGHEVVGVSMAEEVDDEPTGFVSDLYIIDINLPGEDGISLAQRIRRSQPDVGIVIISARSSVDDRIGGYKSGANIYLTKPLSLEELRAVVDGIVLRLLSAEASHPTAIRLSPMKMLVTGPAGAARLTQPEVVLLAALSRAPQRELEHWQVATHLGNGEEISKENLEVKLGRLRKKLVSCGAEVPAIQSLRGIGYRLTAPIEILSE
ncbi:DNA-binding response regulator [Aestuariivirga litoralis]|uniref:DNA-binding response regulator n=1 Tax=Aestuariivirga litoralis TaxID=2650924 RepID=A0A2W2AQ83_9HYPH|nr:response regulator transcription factor [Aestuariivirga litoralis]PZF77571.1 DNA-binding response regulator [Aestuariivirga litoralis]